MSDKRKMTDGEKEDGWSFPDKKEKVFGKIIDEKLDSQGSPESPTEKTEYRYFDSKIDPYSWGKDYDITKNLKIDLDALERKKLREDEPKLHSLWNNEERNWSDDWKEYMRERIKKIFPNEVLMKREVLRKTYEILEHYYHELNLKKNDSNVLSKKTRIMKIMDKLSKLLLKKVKLD